MTDRYVQILEIIRQNPGIQFRQIMRASNLQNGVLSHYLARLERNGVIKAVRGPRQARFFPPHITDEQSVAIKALRRHTPRSLLLALMGEAEGLEFSQLVKATAKSPATISSCLSQLVSEGLVELRTVQPRKRYHIKARGMIDQLIEDYVPGPLEKPASGFEDIINSL